MTQLRRVVSTLLLFSVAASGHFGGAGELRGGTDAGSSWRTEEVVGPLPFIESGAPRLRPLEDGDEVPTLALVLPRCRYWLEDGHLEVVVLLTPPPEVDLAETVLRLEWTDGEGNAISCNKLAPPPWPNLALYPPIHGNQSGDFTIRATWSRGGDILGEASRGFRIDTSGAAAFPEDGIPLQIANPHNVVAEGIPFSVGIPFSRGMLADVSSLHLVAADGTRIPAQFKATGRWSKYGSLKWVRCDFTAELNGQPLSLFLVKSAQSVPPTRREITVEAGAAGIPAVDAGVITLDDGLWLRTDGDRGERTKILTARALAGGFVEHEDGRLFQMPLGAPYSVEEVGPERIVLLQRGWYQNDDDRNDEFCQFEVRLILYRDSPLLRVFHTWIFTGDSSRDRIRTMGWQLPMAEAATGGAAFRSAFGPAGEWIGGDYLLQYGHRGFDIASDGTLQPFDDGRAPGIARLEMPQAAIYFGTRNFWQSFPSEIEFADNALWLHSWPRHGRPRPEPLVDPGRAVMLDFAHGGEVLDLRLPDAYADPPLDTSHAAYDSWNERVWLTTAPEAVNAQGLARTEEFWLYFDSNSQGDANAVALLEGIDLETIRAVVEPQWMMQTGVFFEAHHSDPDNYPEFERMFSEIIAPLNINRVERAGLYGMWLYGEHLWDWHNLGNLYRALRKGHGGYGALSWMPYARSGDPQLLKWHDASTRHMIDANFCHYVDPDVAAKARGGRDLTRRPGFWARGPLPWAGRALGVLCYERQPHQWWNAWHITGYHRARDMGLTYRDLAKEYIPEMRPFTDGQRTIETIQQAFVDSYENTFDPWFLVWTDAFGDFHRRAWQQEQWQPYGRNWSTGDREYHRFSGCREHAEFYADFVRSSVNSPNALAYAWHITGDEWFLRRLSAAYLDLIDAEQGSGFGGRVDSSADLPMMLGAFEAAGAIPPPINSPFAQRKVAFKEGDTRVFHTPTAAFIKPEGEELELFLGLIRLQTYRVENDQRTYRLYSPDGELYEEGDFSVDTYANRPGFTLTIPADAPGGAWRLDTEFRSIHANSHHGYVQLRGIRFPVTPPGTPEVLLIDEDRMGPASLGGVHFTPAYYFHVPADVESFHVENISSRAGAVIRNADGDPVWQHPAGGSQSATIDVPPDQRNRLWRIRGLGFTMDPAIPPVYAIDPDRWFMPGQSSEE